MTNPLPAGSRARRPSHPPHEEDAEELVVLRLLKKAHMQGGPPILRMGTRCAGYPPQVGLFSNRLKPFVAIRVERRGAIGVDLSESAVLSQHRLVPAVGCP